ncbi:MAG: hypothetical protein GY757_28735 [bacterium]|nr:hypothetical protein [bacterium]
MKYNHIKQPWIYILILFLFLPSPAQQEAPQKLESLLSLINQKSGLTLQLPDSGWLWKDGDCKGSTEKGELTFNDSKWLMYLIHWGPIQVETLSVDYVKKRMLNMWGVPFQFTGKEGKTSMAGHDAIYVEAYGTNKAFFTRFIVWNCPESGREFIADTNYNLALKTPVKDFEKERTSARSLQCHKNAPTKDAPGLTAAFDSRKYRFSFYYPGHWFIFESPYYVPFPQYEGIRSDKTGSLLGLCSDQNVRVTLKWLPLDKKEKKKTMLGVDTGTNKILVEALKATPGLKSHKKSGSESFQIDSKPVSRIWGKYTHDIPEKQKAFLTGNGIFQAVSVELKEKGKNVIIILQTQQYKYDPAVSSPTRNFQDIMMRDLIKGLK